MPQDTQVFRTLHVGQVVTVPYVRPEFPMGDPHVVEILTAPAPCPEGCGAYQVTALDLVSGVEVCIHRRAGRPVVPAQRPATRTS